tara:strand:+ start:81 stop:971 length:891 start_codon:yes stop_codon:yes gene_type:complete
MWIVFFVIIIVESLTTNRSVAQDFYSHWGDGRAEISSYHVNQSHYGESREGYGVLIFVTEDLNTNTMVKVESPIPSEDLVYVLKLNNVLKFKTGIYDYSIMTSVFSTVEPRLGETPFELQKLSFSSQEWCGHVFEDVYPSVGDIRGNLHSYFEHEGTQKWEIERPHNFESEDHLLIRIRELKGEWLKLGDSVELNLLPSLWKFRVRHEGRKLFNATVTKRALEQIEVSGEMKQAVQWHWKSDHGETLVWVEQAAPHRILGWDDQGSSAKIIKTIRVPYWQLNTNVHESFREQLGIP